MARAISIMYFLGIAVSLTLLQVVIVDFATGSVGGMYYWPGVTIFAVFSALLSVCFFPIALYSAAEGSLDFWGYGDLEPDNCCHMGTLSDGFAISGMMQHFAPAAILSSVAVVQWFVWRKVKIKTTLLMAAPALVLWTANAAAGLKHALRMCFLGGGC